MNPVKEHHKFYFDNFFTSYELILQLRDIKMKATGTVRDGRLGDATLPNKREFSKAKRGKYQYCCDGKVCFVRWSDNNVVTCASNFEFVNPVVMVERHGKGANVKKKVTQPRMIANYTAGIGGVDLCDRLLLAYRPRIKGKKWWWNLFINTINTAVVASWKIHWKVLSLGRPSHLKFRREIVAGLLKSVARPRLGGPTSATPPCVRYDGFQNFIGSTSQGRCAHCSKNTMNCITLSDYYNSYFHYFEFILTL